MIEIYLFINPLGKLCLDMEEQLLALVEHENKKIQLRFIPLMNLKTVTDFINRKGIEASDIKERNRWTSMIYSATLDFKAAQLQGKRRGRQFLLSLQRAIHCDGKHYSRELARQLFAEAGGDLEMFIEDRESAFVAEAFTSDQEIAREMGIRKHPSAVVYNYACDRDFGVLIEDCRQIAEITKLCQTTEDTLKFFHDQRSRQQSDFQTANGTHLYLI